VGKVFHIVIVDDDQDDHFLLKDAIQQLDLSFEITPLYSGIELLDYLDAHEAPVRKIDFIVMDINMPSMNGLIALSKLKTDQQFRHIPVFMLSTTRDESTYSECKKQGALDFYTKPNNNRDLKKILRDMFQHVGAR
jgi:CheY-like chemotaxis protein